MPPLFAAATVTQRGLSKSTPGKIVRGAQMINFEPINIADFIMIALILIGVYLAWRAK